MLGYGSNGHKQTDGSIKILANSGSLRKHSYNTGLLRATQDVLPDNVEMTIYDLKDLPLYDGDVETAGDPEAVTRLKEAVREADGVLFTTPEYNHGISGVLKNAIDWVSRDKSDGSLIGKPVAMMGAGGWDGTARAQSQLETVLSGAGALPMIRPGVLVAMAWDKFDEDGNLLDQETKAFLRAQVEALTEWIGKVGSPREVAIAA